MSKRQRKSKAPLLAIIGATVSLLTALAVVIDKATGLLGVLKPRPHVKSAETNIVGSSGTAVVATNAPILDSIVWSKEVKATTKDGGAIEDWRLSIVANDYNTFGIQIYGAISANKDGKRWELMQDGALAHAGLQKGDSFIVIAKSGTYDVTVIDQPVFESRNFGFKGGQPPTRIWVAPPNAPFTLQVVKRR